MLIIIEMKVFVLAVTCLPLILATLTDSGRNFLSPVTDDIVPLIIGGGQARAGQFPYAAALYVKTSDSLIFCGGALLSTQWIITAGHCIQNATEIDILLGSNSLTEDDPNRIKVATSGFDCYLHPEFDVDSLDNDVGLIKLRQKIQYSDYIDKCYLPVTPYDAGVNVTAIGWGQVTDSEPGPVDYLNFVKLITISNEECRIPYGQSITDNMICVVGQYNEGMCSGDSGTPLIYLLNNQHPIVVGVASFHSANGCEDVNPSGYTRVFTYRDWILNITGSLND